MIFGSTNLTVDDEVYLHVGSTTDLVMNYIFASLTLLAMLLGIVCNIAVLYYNTVVNKKHVASIIYRFIAMWDLAYCLIRCPQQIYTLVKPGVSPFFGESVSILQRCLSVFNLSDTLIMGALISLLAVIRFTFLTAPIWSYVHKTAIKRAALTYVCLVHVVTIAVLINYLTSPVHWFGPCQWAIPQGHFFIHLSIDVIFYLSLGAGISFSVLTAGWIVVKNRQGERNEGRNQVSVTIILMNVGLVIFLIFWIFLDQDLPEDEPSEMARYVNTRYHVYYLYYAISNLFPMVLAAYNPLVICLRCGDLRKRIRTLISIQVSGEIQPSGELKSWSDFRSCLSGSASEF